MGTSLLVFTDGATREQSSFKAKSQLRHHYRSPDLMDKKIWIAKADPLRREVWSRATKVCSGMFSVTGCCVCVCMLFVFMCVVCMCGNGPWSDLLINGQCVYV